MTELLQDYVELMNGSKLYLAAISQRDWELKIIEAERAFAPQLMEQPFYWTVEPDEKGRGGEKALWTAADVEKDGTEAEKAAWAAYEQNQAERSRFIDDYTFEFILKECTARLVTPAGNELNLTIDPVTYEWQPPEAWLKRQAGDLPTDPYELKFLYLSSMIKDIYTRRELVLRMRFLYLRGVVSEEDYSRMADLFRRAMAAEGRRSGTLLEQSTPGDEAGESASLDVQLSQVGNESSPILGNRVTEPMGQPEPAG
jgi:hypothetical protein